MIDLLELHEDANDIWIRANNEADYMKMVEIMRSMSIDEFNNARYIKRTIQEIQEYLNKLKKLR